MDYYREQYSLEANKTGNSDKQLCVFISAYIIFNNINSTLQTAFGFTGPSLSYIKLLIQVCLLLLLVRSFNHMKLSAVRVFVISEAFVIVLCGYSLLVGAKFPEMSSWGFSLITTGIPLFAATYNIKEKKELYNMLIPTSWIILFISVLNYLFSKIEYDMHFSYSLLLVLLIHINELLVNKRKKYLFSSVIVFLLIFLHGSRGGLFCFGVFLGVTILSSGYSLSKKIITAITTVLALAFLAVLWSNCKYLFLDFLISHGINSRTLLFLISGDFMSNHTGRDLLWTISIELIRERPFFGWGIGGAAYRFAQFGSHQDIYPHQIFLDYFVTFGCFFGSLLGAFTCYEAIKTLFASKSSRGLYIIFLCIGFASLLFTGTVYTFYYFYIFLGLALSLNGRIKVVI